MCVMDPAYIPVGVTCAARGLGIKLGHARAELLCICYVAFKVTSPPDSWLDGGHVRLCRLGLQGSAATTNRRMQIISANKVCKSKSAHGCGSGLLRN